MTVVILSVTPERLRGSLTRWLLEIGTGVYVGHIPARVRDLLWARIVEDVGRGRALMVWSRRGEQRLDFRAHNHAWETVDHDGVTLMRRSTPESRRMAKISGRQIENQKLSGTESWKRTIAGTEGPATALEGEGANDERRGSRGTPRTGWSKVGRRRRYGTIAERKRRKPAVEDPQDPAE